MNDVKARDRVLFWKEALSVSRIFVTFVFVAMSSLILKGITHWPSTVALVICAAPFVAIHMIASLGASVPKRFSNLRIRSLWLASEDRYNRFQDEIKLLRKHQVADLNELPRTISGVARQLYMALRRADMVLEEVTRSEGKGSQLLNPPPVMTADKQAQELYRVADKNVAEYRQHFQLVMGGVQRAEAQAAVFTTTLDMLRMKMLGYRLTGKGPDGANLEFLQSITEAKMQLEAIDKALDELELSPFPKTIAIVPDAPLQQTLLDAEERHDTRS